MTQIQAYIQIKRHPIAQELKGKIKGKTLPKSFKIPLEIVFIGKKNTHTVKYDTRFFIPMDQEKTKSLQNKNEMYIKIKNSHYILIQYQDKYQTIVLEEN